jgi:hypothetical protein
LHFIGGSDARLIMGTDRSADRQGEDDIIRIEDDYQRS